MSTAQNVPSGQPPNLLIDVDAQLPLPNGSANRATHIRLAHRRAIAARALTAGPDRLRATHILACRADYDHYHDMVDLSWFSHGGPKITGITTTPSELERNGRALDSANGSDMEVDGRRENDNAAAFARRLFYDEHRNWGSDEGREGKQNPRASLSVSVTDVGIELQSPSMGQKGARRSSRRLSGAWLT